MPDPSKPSLDTLSFGFGLPSSCWPVVTGLGRWRGPLCGEGASDVYRLSSDNGDDNEEDPTRLSARSKQGTSYFKPCGLLRTREWLTVDGWRAATDLGPPELCLGSVTGHQSQRRIALPGIPPQACSTLLILAFFASASSFFGMVTGCS